MKNKKTMSVLAAYSIVLVLYIFAYLIIPLPKTAASWVAFGFTVVAIAASLAVCVVAFRRGTTYISRIYGFPIFKVGLLYALSQFAFGAVVCVLGAFVSIPTWIVWLISGFLLGAGMLGVIAADNTRDIVEELEKKQSFETKNAVYFQISIADIIDRCEDMTAKRELQKVEEILCYSDPVSSKETEESEEKIRSLIAELQALLPNGSSEDILNLSKNLTNAIRHRNRICKASK